MKTNNKNNSDSKNKKFLIPKEVSKILRMSYPGVLDMIKLGQLPSYQFGNRYLVKENELYDYIENHRFKSYWSDKEL